MGLNVTFADKMSLNAQKDAVQQKKKVEIWIFAIIEIYKSIKT